MRGFAAEHRQECLCHIALRYLLKRGVFAGSNVAQTLLSVPGGEAAPYSFLIDSLADCDSTRTRAVSVGAWVRRFWMGSLV